MRLLKINPAALSLLQTNDSHVVLGATENHQYATLKGTSPDTFTPVKGYRVTIDRDTGRIVRIVDHRVRTRGNETSERRIRHRFTYGNTSIQRPGWVDWHPMELVFDAFSL